MLRGVLVLVLLLPQLALAADDVEGDFGGISLWEVSGVTGPAEAYENQLSLAFEPSVKLGRIPYLKGLHPLLRAVRVSMELLLQFELAGNDGNFHGTQYAGPLLPGGAESIAINETGQVVGVRTGQVDGTGRRALVSDLWLGFSQPSLYTIPFANVDLGARLSMTFPTSPVSRATGLYLALGFGFDLSRTFWSRWDVGYSLRYTQYLHRYSTEDMDHLEGTVEVNGREEPLYHPTRGTVLNPAFGVVNELSTSVKIIKGLSVSASYSLINTFTHTLPESTLDGLPLADPCRDGPAVADAVGGSLVRCGERAQRDKHWFQLHLTYQLPWVQTRMLSVVFGLSTLQPVRHEGVNISNPFVQTAPTTNYTTLELGVRADLEHTAAALWRLMR